MTRVARGLPALRGSRRASVLPLLAGADGDAQTGYPDGVVIEDRPAGCARTRRHARAAPADSLMLPARGSLTGVLSLADGLPVGLAPHRAAYDALVAALRADRRRP